ncbi:MAG: MBL fold metallo-hydrolase [Oceanicaulis sp.]|uniref:MBL fold metallo-hydrolase n=1 Tax=Glycocaulis sp. TaxID=1969725 RepID=UPI0025BC36A5|nr:MBL fold metallo-hydrolase [Glycocaulis sp.]MCC5981460.1 MBL fold metallo-hydrolase [Oceanicaulis sp.]MCH8522509.1 MBL fold metallo-hydrolase [Glycocaulis sp.]
MRAAPTPPPPIPFVREMAFEPGRCDPVSPLVRRVVARNASAFTYTGTATFIVGQGELAVIDPGPAEEAHFEALNRAIDGERVSHVIVTHHHLDHSALARRFADHHGVKVYGLPAQGVTPMDPDAPVMEEGADFSFTPDENLKDDERLSGPGWTLEVLHTPGHAANHLCLALLEENALFSGDHIMGWATSVVLPPDGDMGDYLVQLERVRKRGFATLWPTHGPPVTDPDPFIAAYIAHRHYREAQILHALEAGPATIRALLPAMYAGLDERLFPAAAMSVLSHMSDLHARGIIACEGAPGLESVYRLA